jgi:cysteine desulfurase
MTTADTGADQVIYLDHQATTPVDPRVLDAMLPYLTTAYGNPSSPYGLGRQAADAVRTARGQLRDLLGADAETEIIFTSGATESDCLAIAGTARALGGAGDHIITTSVEHRAVLAACQELAGQGFLITVVSPGADGIVDPADIASAITPATTLVSVMHANNEIGTIQPIAEIGRITRDRGVLLHTDAAQSLGTVDFTVGDLGVDLLSLTAHKIYGPKGIGALYIRRGTVRPAPLISGGGQEQGLRAGTANVPGIAGLGAAAAILTTERQAEAIRIAWLRDQLLARLRAALPGMRVNGTMSRRLPGNLNVVLPGTDAGRLIDGLSDVAISAGSACDAGHSEPSHVLTAIGLDEPAARSSVRIGLGRGTTLREVVTASEPGRCLSNCRATREPWRPGCRD